MHQSFAIDANAKNLTRWCWNFRTC